MATCEIKLTIKRDKVFDEMLECLSDVREIIEMIPEYQQHEARPIAQRILERFKSWIELEQDGL